MDIGRISSIFTPRPATGPVPRESVARVVDPVDEAPEQDYVRRARPVDYARTLEGELLQRDRGTSQPSTQDFLDSRRYQADSAQSHRASTRASLSSSNRHALGQYLNHTRPETYQSLIQGRTVDTFV